jgi:glycosyltransferase involved in cell wall biosynthesis
VSVRVLFDVTRLLWREGRGSPTGIDRVVQAYGRWLVAARGVAVQPVAISGEEVVAVSAKRLRALLERGDGPGHGAGSAAMQALEAATPFRWDSRPHAPSSHVRLAADAALHAAARLSRPAPTGDLYVNVAHSGLHKGDLLGRLSRRGVRPVVMIHDLIPITHPEFCAPGAEARHRRRIDAALDHADLVIANSQATAADLAAYAEANGKRSPPVIAAPLGIEARFHGLGGARAAPARRAYFICVGTIEARKNLAFLLTLWRRLAERLGEAAPQLIIVGRRGWENEAVIDHLERSHAVQALVHEVGDLSDDELATLMAGARALLAPSLAEGFDLPLIEALALGVPAIASDIPVHRELASAATLVDPIDGAGWIAAIEAACASDRRRASAFAAPTWERHFALVDEALLRGHG